MKEIAELDGALVKLSAIEYISTVHNMYVGASCYEQGFYIRLYNFSKPVYIRKGEGSRTNENPMYTEQEINALNEKHRKITEALKLYHSEPVETTNEQPTLPTDLKIELLKVMSKHINLRNSDKITDRDLYHSFLDWEKEMHRLIV